MKKIFIVICALLIISCGKKIEITLEPTNPPYMAEEVSQLETFHNVPTDILDRLIQSESSWRYTVINRQEDSRGLAQVNMKYFKYFQKTYGIKDPMNPWQSLCFAADYLHDLYLATGSWYKAVLAYKTGLNRIDKAPEHIRRIAWWVALGE